MMEKQPLEGETKRQYDAYMQVKQRDPKEPAGFGGDKVGFGRYLICFLLAGPLGLLAAYWARYYGWRCLVIILVLFGLLWMGSFCIGFIESVTQTCYYDYAGRYVCE